VLAYGSAGADLVRKLKGQLAPASLAGLLTGLAEGNNRSLWDLFTECLPHPAPAVRAAAIRGLNRVARPGFLGIERNVPQQAVKMAHDYAMQVLFDPSDDVRAEAVQTLDTKRVEPATWRRIVGDVSPKVRIAVVPFMKQLDPDFAAPLLWNLKIDRDESVRN